MATFARSSLAQAAGVSLTTAAAAALLGLVLAYWTWAWFAPPPESPVEATPDSTDRISQAGGLFGSAQRGQNATASVGRAIKLLGLVAASPGRRGYAVLQLDARQILAVPEGSDISPGLRLAQVATDHVVLERGGSRESLAWPQKAVPASSNAPQKFKK